MKFDRIEQNLTTLVRKIALMEGKNKDIHTKNNK